MRTVRFFSGLLALALGAVSVPSLAAPQGEASPISASECSDAAAIELLTRGAGRAASVTHSSGISYDPAWDAVLDDSMLGIMDPQLDHGSIAQRQHVANDDVQVRYFVLGSAFVASQRPRPGDVREVTWTRVETNSVATIGYSVCRLDRYTVEGWVPAIIDVAQRGVVPFDGSTTTSTVSWTEVAQRGDVVYTYLIVQTYGYVDGEWVLISSSKTLIATSSGSWPKGTVKQ